MGVVCAARFPFDSKYGYCGDVSIDFSCGFRWYRAVVMEKRVNEGGGGGGAFEYLCFFGDYGDCEWVNEKCVQPIDNNLLQVKYGPFSFVVPKHSFSIFLSMPTGNLL